MNLNTKQLEGIKNLNCVKGKLVNEEDAAKLFITIKKEKIADKKALEMVDQAIDVKFKELVKMFAV